jgi:hypothetical protein
VEKVEDSELRPSDPDAQLVDAVPEVITVGATELVTKLTEESEARLAPRIRPRIAEAKPREPCEDGHVSVLILEESYLDVRQGMTP